MAVSEAFYRAIIQVAACAPGSFYATMRDWLSPGLKLDLQISECDSLTAAVRSDDEGFQIVIGDGLIELGPLIESVVDGLAVNSAWKRWCLSMWGVFGSRRRNREQWKLLQSNLFGMAIEFAIAHEIGHAAGGHFDLLRPHVTAQSLELSDSYPMPETGKMPPLAPLERQAMELHADLIAAYILRGTVETRVSHFAPKSASSRDRAEMARFAAMCLAFFLARRAVPNDVTLRDWANATHPHPLNRLRALAADVPVSSDARFRSRALDYLVGSRLWADWRSTAFVPSAEPGQFEAPQVDELASMYPILIDHVIALDKHIGNYRKRIVMLSRGELLTQQG